MGEEVLDYLSLALFFLEVVTAWLFGFDKYRAKTGGRRVSERTLLLWCLAGGWVGGVLAMWIIKHKVRKASFVRRFRLVAFASTVVWIGFVVYALRL